MTILEFCPRFNNGEVKTLGLEYEILKEDCGSKSV
jgi:hypothetical protein